MQPLYNNSVNVNRKKVVNYDSQNSLQKIPKHPNTRKTVNNSPSLIAVRKYTTTPN